jgi:hypothetical protein
LFEEPKAVFQMKPDIVVTNKVQDTIFIMDTASAFACFPHK